MQDKLLKLWKDVVEAHLGTTTQYSLRRPNAVLHVCRVIFETGVPPPPQTRIKGSELRPVARRKQLIQTEAEGLRYHVCHSYGLS